MSRQILNENKTFLNKIKIFFAIILTTFSNAIKFITQSHKNTKISFIIMGYGHFKTKQYLKGCIYLGIQIAYIYYFITLGWSQFYGLITLGDKSYDLVNGIVGDHSTFMLVYGVFSWLITFVFICIYIYSIKECEMSYKQIAQGKSLPKAKELVYSLINNKLYITFLILPVIGALLFTIIPLVFMILIAFTNFGAPNHLPPAQLVDWVGLGSFKKLLSLGAYSKTIGKILVWNITWAIVATTAYYLGGVGLAVLLNKKSIKGKKLYRSCIMLSFAVPQFISLLGLRFFFSSFGPINQVLMKAFNLAQPIDFLVGKWPARTTAFFVGGWLAIPSIMLLATGILNAIPDELYEVGKIEGASSLQIFRHLTLPYVIFATTPVLIGQFMANFNNFGLFFYLTGTRPYSDGYFLANDSDLLINWLYNLSLENSYYSIAAVVGLILFVIMSCCSLIVYTRSNAYKKEDQFQ